MADSHARSVAKAVSYGWNQITWMFRQAGEGRRRPALRVYFGEQGEVVGGVFY